MNCPVVSIVIPSYNQGAFLEQTLQSVLRQSYPAIECIVIDGCSTDGSVEVIQKYQEKLAFWVSEKDAGQADAINKGFARATGKYLTWLNSDDILYPHTIAALMEFMKANPQVDFVYGDVDQGFDGGPISTRKGKAMSFSDMVRTMDVPVPQQGSLWKGEVIERIGGLDSRWHVVLDREFFLRIAEHCEMHYLPVTLGFFRQHANAKSVAQQVLWLDELPVLYRDFFARPHLKPDILTLRREALGVMGLQCAVLSLRNGLYRKAFHFVGYALTNDPTFIFRRGTRKMLWRFIIRIWNRRTGYRNSSN
jgi:glycosyltransferase involved in cell wall biosynthesis